MNSRKKALPILALIFAASCIRVAVAAHPIPDGAVIDAEVTRIMANTHANGMAVAVVDHGKVGYVRAFGIRNAKRDPLTPDTVMYGASITKTVFAYAVLRLVDEGKLDLDKPLKDDLDNPLPSYGPDPVFPDKYGPYKDLAGDSRWKGSRRVCALLIRLDFSTSGSSNQIEGCVSISNLGHATAIRVKGLSCCSS